MLAAFPINTVYPLLPAAPRTDGPRAARSKI